MTSHPGGDPGHGGPYVDRQASRSLLSFYRLYSDYLLPHVLVCLYDLSVGSCDPYLYEHVMYGSLEPLNKGVVEFCCDAMLYLHISSILCVCY